MNSLRSVGAAGLLMAFGGVTTGCQNLLDVDNPASITDEDIRTPETADAWANGSMRLAQRGWDQMLALLSTVSDEVTYVGANQWWGDLDLGRVDDPGNSGLNTGFSTAAQSLWMADETLDLLIDFHEARFLRDPSLLARAYLYGAIAYAVIAESMEDYAPSDRTEPGPALGPDNMPALFDTAVAYAARGHQVQAGGELGRDLLAMRARAQHAREIRTRVFPPPADLSGGGLVASEGATRDALFALVADASDWRFLFEFPQLTVESRTAFHINCSPQNLRFGDVYVRPTPDGRMGEEVILLDPLDSIPDPWLEDFIFTFQEHPNGLCDNVDLTVTSAREMHLIVAEDALTRGDLETFMAHVNQVRAWGSLTPWTPESGISARDLLIYERQSQLFLTGRRLMDMYRFGVTSETWEPAAAASRAPGSLFPIPSNEIEANCHLNPDVAC